MGNDVINRILQLVKAGLEEMDRPDSRLTRLVNIAIRVARLRGDYENLGWLRMETVDLLSELGVKNVRIEMASRFSREQMRRLMEAQWMAYCEEREFNGYNEQLQEVRGKLIGASVANLEMMIDHLKSSLAIPDPTYVETDPTLKSLSNYMRSIKQTNLAAYNVIKSRISQRVYEFLSGTESQLVLGRNQPDIFERNRRYVEERLRYVAPDALEQLLEASNRATEGKPESRSHAALSCRRALKTLADKLYPAHKDPVQCIDGEERILTDDKYISRLWQFISNKMSNAKSGSGELLLSQMTDLGNRIDAVYNLDCEGIHDSLNEFECDQCVINTWFIIGDVLRIADDTSAVGLESQ